jgi:hypothetical protein
LTLLDTLIVIYFIYQLIAVIHLTIFLRKKIKAFYQSGIKGRTFRGFYNRVFPKKEQAEVVHVKAELVD